MPRARVTRASPPAVGGEVTARELGWLRRTWAKRGNPPLELVGSAGRSRHGLRRQSGPAAPRQRPKGTLTFANLCPGPHGVSYGARGILGGVWGMNPSTASLANSSISRLKGTPARAAQHERAGRRWPTGEVSAHGTICLSVAARSPSPQTVGVVAVTDRLDRLGGSGGALPHARPEAQCRVTATSRP